MFTGLLREESRDPLEDLHILPQPAVLPAQLSQLPPLGTGQAAVLPGSGIPFRLLDPLPDRGLGQVEVPVDLADVPVPPRSSSSPQAAPTASPPVGPPTVRSRRSRSSGRSPHTAPDGNWLAPLAAPSKDRVQLRVRRGNSPSPRSASRPQGRGPGV